MYRFHFFSRTDSRIGGAFVVEDLFAGTFAFEVLAQSQYVTSKQAVRLLKYPLETTRKQLTA